MIIVEAVDDSTRDEEHLTRADLGLLSVERPGQHALKPVDRLLITVMAVCGRHSGCGWDVELEDCDRTSRLLPFEPKSDRNLPDPDLFRHRGLLSPLLLSVSEPYPSEGEAKTMWSKGQARKRISEKTPSRTFVNKGRKKGRGPTVEKN